MKAVKKGQTSSYKRNKYYGGQVQLDKYNYHCCMLYMKAVKRGSPKTSHHKKIKISEKKSTGHCTP